MSEKQVKCPNCEQSFAVNLTAVVPPSQRLQLRLTRDANGKPLAAGTISGLIANTDKLMKAIAKEIGAKVAVFVERVDWEDDGITVHFLITNVSGSNADQKAMADRLAQLGAS